MGQAWHMPGPSTHTAQHIFLTQFNSILRYLLTERKGKKKKTLDLNVKFFSRENTEEAT